MGKSALTALSIFFVLFFCFQQVTLSGEDTPKLKPEDVPDLFSAEVLKVVDGDTINIKALGQKKLAVRFLNIDAPECHFQDKDKEYVKQEYCEEAMQFIADRVKVGATVSIKTDVEKLDRYGRILGHVIVGDKDLNLEILRAGWVALYVIYPNIGSLDDFIKAAKEAYDKKRGIFDPQKPIDLLPFEFRLNASGREADKWTGDVTNKLFYRPINYKLITYYNRLFFFKFNEAEKAGYNYKERFLFEFDKPVISTLDIFSTVSFSDTLLLNRAGYPSLPFKNINILIPYGKEIGSFEFQANQLKKINGEYTILPGAYNIPIGQNGIRVKDRIDERIYSRDENLPDKLYSNLSLQKYHGYNFLNLNIFPLKYNPAKKSLFYYKQLLIEISFKNKAPDTHSALRFDTERVEKIPADADLLFSYPEFIKSVAKNKKDEENSGGTNSEEKKKEKIGYLVITNEKLYESTFSNNFQRFLGFLSKYDLDCAIETVENIYGNYQGRDKAEKIRNYIKDLYSTKNIRYVLLGGDGDEGNEVIPVRKFTASFRWDNVLFNDDIPSDYYYSALDGDFDSNKNAYFAEVDDGIDGEEIDLYPEIFIGRAPVQTEEELAHFIEKTIYAHENRAKSALFISEKLYKNVDGASYMEEINKGAKNFGISTAGYPVSWDKSFLYEKNKIWALDDLLGMLDNPIFMINHIGISSHDETMKLNSELAGELSNELPFFLYTQGNNSGQFTYTDSIVERLLTAKNGAFAAVANSSMGLAPENPDSEEGVITRGASQHFHRQFTDAIFSGNGKRTGEANQISKIKNIPWMGEGQFRWVFFELNLLGDPYLPIE